VCCGGSGDAGAPTAGLAGASVEQQTLADVGADGLSQPLAVEAADGAAREARYFRLTKDTRSCAAPACGGVYATTMNTNVQITCPNGETSASCYVGRLDADALGYSPFDASGGEPVKVKGTLTPGRAFAGGLHYGHLVVEKVFVPVATPTHLMHHLYVVTNNGLACATRPCLKYNSQLANRSRGHDVSSFDFSTLGLTTAQVRDFRHAVDRGDEVLIQVGPGQTLETANGTDVREGVLGLFMPVGAAPVAGASQSVAPNSPAF
jgi:hypothetical protein